MFVPDWGSCNGEFIKERNAWFQPTAALKKHSTAPVMLTRESREALYCSAQIRGMRVEVLLVLTFGFVFLKSGAYYCTD